MCLCRYAKENRVPILTEANFSSVFDSFEKLKCIVMVLVPKMCTETVPEELDQVVNISLHCFCAIPPGRRKINSAPICND